MWSQSAPPLIILLHSADSCPKSEAKTDGEMIGRGIETQEVAGFGQSSDVVGMWLCRIS
jgi:hypothetical protein